MASAQVVETSVNKNNSPSQDYTTNPDDHSNHNNAISIVNERHLLDLELSKRPFDIIVLTETHLDDLYLMKKYFLKIIQFSDETEVKTEDKAVAF